jgi:hypothetical protein
MSEFAVRECDTLAAVEVPLSVLAVLRIDQPHPDLLEHAHVGRGPWLPVFAEFKAV